MPTRKIASIALLALGFCFASVSASRAAIEMPFAQAAFAESQKTGKPILVYVNASWCPTCAQQRPIIEGLIKDPAFKDLIIYQVDFDKQKDVVRSMGARMQSTLIAFQGAKETARSVGDTNAPSIRALFEKTNPAR